LCSRFEYLLFSRILHVDFIKANDVQFKQDGLVLLVIYMVLFEELDRVLYFSNHKKIREET